MRLRCGLITGLCLIVLVACGCREATYTGTAMNPTIAPGEEVAVNRAAYVVSRPRRWDVVAFERTNPAPSLWFMRVVGLPGETVSFASNGISLNGTPLVYPTHLTNLVHMSLDGLGKRSSIRSPYVVPADAYFVLGDGPQAYDSKFWGALPFSNVVGRVLEK
ncbi:MAG: signal peptidase I [Verrucomicrobia bacterium]|nr:signal peptidase I [Verrucomicrobiota bacterium]